MLNQLGTTTQLLGRCVFWRQWLAQNHDPNQTTLLLQESVAQFRKDKNDTEANYPLVFLARIEQIRGNDYRAETFYQQALIVVHETQQYNLSSTPSALLGLGYLATGQGRYGQAARLLSAAEQDLPVCSAYFRVRILIRY